MAKILVIGGNSGIGLATVELFKEHQHEVQSVSRSNHFDFTKKERVEEFFKQHTDFNQVVVTATTPLVIGSFRELDIADARNNFEKYWGMVHVVYYASKPKLLPR